MQLIFCMEMIDFDGDDYDLQYLKKKKEVRSGVHFLHADKHQVSTSWHYRF